MVGARREARASTDLDQSPTLPTPDRSDIARDDTNLNVFELGFGAVRKAEFRSRFVQ